MASHLRKSDDDAIATVVADVAARHWPGDAAAWPGCLFHVTDIRNAVSILARGTLLSRAEAIRRDWMVNDNAHPRIIAEAPDWLRSQVRLYFRPRTPTFAVNEGIHLAQRNDAREDDDAHCPVPVAFVFDAPEVLGMAGARFSRGSLARWTVQPTIGEDAAFLASLPWEDIYNCERIPTSDDCAGMEEDGVSDGEREICIRADRIRYHRQSEIIVPDSLSLDSLVRVGVRSHAEWRTLQALLADHGASPRLMAKVGVEPKLFWRIRPHADHAFQRLAAGSVYITFKSGLHSGMPLSVVAAWEDPDGRVIEQGDLPPFKPNLGVLLLVPATMRSGPFRLTLWVEGSLAFSAWFDPGAEAMIDPAR